MKHEIDLKKFNYYTDLTIESLKNNNIDLKQTVNKYKDIIVTDIDVDDETSKIIGKKNGKYITLEFEDATDSDNQQNIIEILTNELNKFIDVNKDELILIIGLGNDMSTPDSLGPKCIDKIVVTNHIYELNLLDDNYNRTALFKPSVLGKTGIETSDIITSIVNIINPKLVIVIDSLASSSIDRLNKTIQITDTGINPGSGIGNKRKEISNDTLHVPVIAIGVPTVVSAFNIVNDTLNYLYKNYNYKDNKLDELFKEVFKVEDFDLVVTPTEIDYVIDCLTKIISSSINNIICKNNN